MAGITGYGAYVPIHRLGPRTKDWAGKTERAVANFDEDSVTMAVSALEDCLRGLDRTTLDALYLASTTLPYEEKQGATIVAVATDLADEIFATDITHSLRSGSIALTLALDAVGARRLKQVAVVVADSRLGAPGSPFEQSAGDGAAALIVGDGDEIAVLEASASVVNEINDVWRPRGETMVRSWEDRFVHQEGYLDSVKRVAAALEARTGRSPRDFDRVVLYAPDARRHAEAARLLGLDRARVQPPLFDRLGNTGAAFTAMQLVSALESVEAGCSLLVISYGDGADALAFRTTPRLAEYRRTARLGVGGHLASKLDLPDYAEYLKWRGLLSDDSGVRRPAGSGPSASALHREQDQLLRFRGGRCRACGAVQYPPQRLCVECHAKDDFEPIRLVGEPAKLFTYSLDYIAGTIDVPMVLSVVDFAIGGRAVLMMTDRDVSQVAVDLPVELTFRQAHSGGGIQSYFWKCMPVRRSAGPAGVG